ncbi:MAG: hypothetical protein ACRCY5_01100 [Phocaeicola sp.]
MKVVIRNSLVILLTLLVTYGGAGVNLFTYCCNDCRSEGVSAILEEKCFDVHESSHAESDDLHAHCGESCQALEWEETLQDRGEASCNINRIDTHWEVSQLSSMALVPILLTLPPFFTTQQACLVKPVVEKICTTHCNNGPPVQPPRSYLSLLTTLLI